jgi:NAD(P)-dependent dehydrogenase (short-subunit alcohol dehydrogenase family)
VPEFSEEGAGLALVDENEAAAEETARQVQDAGGETQAFVGDVSSIDDVDRYVTESAEEMMQRLPEALGASVAQTGREEAHG